MFGLYIFMSAIDTSIMIGKVIMTKEEIKK